MAAEKLTQEEIKIKLGELATWELADGKLHAKFSFGSFAEAFGFMTAVALEAEKLSHHPDWSNSYNTVTVELVTHDADGITDLDFDLAGKIETLAGNFGG